MPYADQEKQVEYHKEYRKRKKVEIAERDKRYYEKNKDRILAKHKEYYENNKEEIYKMSREWRKKNPEKVKAYTKKWSVNNRGKENARAARYRARKRNQTPENANKIWIDLIYEHCPEGHHVDHIVALANGGLHHEDNLQYLTASENRSKGDR